MLVETSCWALGGLRREWLSHPRVANWLMPEPESQSVMLVVELKNLVHENFVEELVVKQLLEALENLREDWVVHPFRANSPVTELEY